MKQYIEEYEANTTVCIINMTNCYEDVHLLSNFLNYNESPVKYLHTLNDVLSTENYSYVSTYILALEINRYSLLENLRSVGCVSARIDTNTVLKKGSSARIRRASIISSGVPYINLEIYKLLVSSFL